MVTYTSSSLYWSPLKPRIRIYEFGDISYSSPLYTYNPFTDIGSTTKPISLNFDSQTTNVGSFSIEIEDKDSALDPDVYTRGNRIFIDCSKDGSTWQPAFKGLVRGIEQNIYATTGRNLILNGYSYLVRLNERILLTIKESTLSGEDYNRNDSNMFTNNLIHNLLTQDTNYVYLQDDNDVYSILKDDNVASSPVTEWIPRLDAQLVTLNDAINSVLEFSNGLVMVNPADDQLMLYTSDLITSATGIFLITNQQNQNADDADYTMYPLEPYKYNISYDYPDSGSRLIGSIGAAGNVCPEIPEQAPVSNPGTGAGFITTGIPGTPVNQACMFRATQTNLLKLRLLVGNRGDWSTVSSMTAQLRSCAGFTSPPGSQIGSNMTLYKDRTPGTMFPEVGTDGWNLGLPSGATGVSGLTINTLYYLVVLYPSGQSGSRKMTWNLTGGDDVDMYGRAFEYGGDWLYPEGYADKTYWSGANGPLTAMKMYFDDGIISPECGGGSQATIDADPVFAVAHDFNMANRLGVVERAITSIPQHIKTKQTLNEYLFNKLYFASKPKFTFDFPSVTMPNKLPKAGDICAHVDSRANVGLRMAPIQTGVVSSVQYTFEQGSGQNDALGLRKLAVTTTGIKRGSY
jgi:hypothetical protein